MGREEIGEISRMFSGGTPNVGIPEYYNGNIPFIRSAEINSDQTELSITDKGLSNSSAKLVEKIHYYTLSTVQLVERLDFQE